MYRGWKANDWPKRRKKPEICFIARPELVAVRTIKGKERGHWEAFFAIIIIFTIFFYLIPPKLPQISLNNLWILPKNPSYLNIWKRGREAYGIFPSMHNICKATTSLRGPCQPKKWIVCIAFSSALHCYNRRYSWGSLVTHNRKRIQDVAVGNICCWKSCPPLFITRSLQFLIHQRFPTHHIRCLHLGWYVLGVEKLQVEENHQDHFFLLQLYITQYTWRLFFFNDFPPTIFPLCCCGGRGGQVLSVLCEQWSSLQPGRLLILHVWYHQQWTFGELDVFTAQMLLL